MRWVASLWLVSKVYIVANIAAVAAILATTQDTETTAAGLVAPLFLLPSILLYVVLARLMPGRPWKHLGYWGPALPLLIYLLMLVGMDMAGRLPEGSGLPAIMAVTFGVPALVAYGFLLRLDRVGD